MQKVRDVGRSAYTFNSFHSFESFKRHKLDQLYCALNVYPLDTHPPINHDSSRLFSTAVCFRFLKMSPDRFQSVGRQKAKDLR